MATISYYQNEIRRCELTKTKIKVIVTKLNLAEKSLTSIDAKIRNEYVIDNRDTTLSARTTRLRNNISSTIRRLNNTIPSIDSQIAYARQQILRLEAEERRRRAEEAARQAALETAATNQTSKGATL